MNLLFNIQESQPHIQRWKKIYKKHGIYECQTSPTQTETCGLLGFRLKVQPIFIDFFLTDYIRLDQHYISRYLPIFLSVETS